jgi:hypothetical protein
MQSLIRKNAHHQIELILYHGSKCITSSLGAQYGYHFKHAGKFKTSQME